MSTITSVDTIADLRSLSSINLNVGDSIFVKRYHNLNPLNSLTQFTANTGGGFFNVVKNTAKDSYYTFNSSTTSEGLSQTGLDINVFSNDTFVLRFMLEPGSISATTNTEIAQVTDVNNNYTKVLVKENSTDKYTVLNNAQTIFIKDDHGNDIDNTELEYYKFYSVGRKLSTTDNIDEITVASSFHGDVKVSVAEIHIGDESWNLNDGSGVTEVKSENDVSIGVTGTPIWKEVFADREVEFNASTSTDGLSQTTGLSIPMQDADQNELFFTMRFKLESGSILSNNTTIARIRQTNGDFTRMIVSDNDGETFSLLPSPINGHTKSIIDDSGREINEEELKYGQFYTVSRGALDPTINTDRVWVSGADSNFINITVSNLNIGEESWLLDEGLGALAVLSENGVSLAVDGTPDFEINSNYDNGFTLIQSEDNHSLYQRVVKDNVVTPYDAGAIDTGNVLDFTQDSTEAFQKVFDSIYEVYVPVGKYYISEELKIRIPKKVTMSGIYAYTTFTGENTAYDNDSISLIYSNLNIDYIRIQSAKVIFTGGLLYAANTAKIPDADGDPEYKTDSQGNNLLNNNNNPIPIPLSEKTDDDPTISRHTKRGFVLDGNYKLWDVKLLHVAVLGNEEDLLEDFDSNRDEMGSTPYLGTIGFELEADDNSIYQYGYFEQIYIEGVARNCNVGVRNINFSDTTRATYKNWQNNHHFHVRGVFCKTFFDINVGSVTISGLQQGGPVRNENEKDRYGVIVASHSSMLDVSIIDPGTSSDEELQGKYRYDDYQYYITPGNSTILGPSMRDNYFTKFFNTDNFMPGSYELVHNPRSFYIDTWSNMISGLNNAITFIGDDGKVSYKGYVAPNQDWFTLNLYNAEDSDDNPTALTQDNGTSIQVDNADVLLTSKQGANSLSGHTIFDGADEDLTFAEVYISDLKNYRNFGNSKITDLFLTTSVAIQKDIQFIIKFEGEDPWSKIVPINLQTDFYRYNWWVNNSNGDFGEHAQKNVEWIIIRFIGTQVSDEKVRIYEISLKQQYQRELPIVRTGGDQKIYGNKDFVLPEFDISPSTASIQQLDIGGVKVVEIDDPGVTSYTLPLISSLDRKNFFIKIKNLTGSTITLGTQSNDEIDEATSVSLTDKEIIEIYVSSNTQYRKSN